MKKHLKLFLPLFFLILTSCNKDKEIRRLLNSDTPNSRIEGAWEAGKSGDKKYVSLLLNDADDPSACTDLRWKGFTVYTEAMFALEQILHVKPPHPYKHILELPDSVNIKFYSQLWQTINSRK